MYFLDRYNINFTLVSWWMVTYAECGKSTFENLYSIQVSNIGTTIHEWQQEIKVITHLQNKYQPLLSDQNQQHRRKSARPHRSAIDQGKRILILMKTSPGYTSTALCTPEDQEWELTLFSNTEGSRGKTSRRRQHRRNYFPKTMLRSL